MGRQAEGNGPLRQWCHIGPYYRAEIIAVELGKEVDKDELAATQPLDTKMRKQNSVWRLRILHGATLIKTALEKERYHQSISMLWISLGKH